MDKDLGLDGLISELLALRPDCAERLGLDILTHAREELLDQGAEIDAKVDLRYTVLSGRQNPSVRRRYATILKSYLENTNLTEFERYYGQALVNGLLLTHLRKVEKNATLLLDTCVGASYAVDALQAVGNPGMPDWEDERKWQLCYLAAQLDSALGLGELPDHARSRNSSLAK